MKTLIVNIRKYHYSKISKVYLQKLQDIIQNWCLESQSELQISIWMNDINSLRDDLKIFDLKEKYRKSKNSHFTQRF